MKYRSLENWKYQLEEDGEESAYVDISDEVFIITDYITLAHGRLTCSACYAWDGPSGPTFDTPTNMRASLFHDALCQLIAEGLLDKKYRKYADELLRTLMLEDQTLYADGLLKTHMPGEPIKKVKKMKGWKRAIYLRWGRFRANGYYLAVRANSKLKGT